MEAQLPLSFYLIHEGWDTSQTQILVWGILVSSYQGWDYSGGGGAGCHSHSQDIYMDSEDLNSGPLACTSALIAELFLQPHFFLFFLK